MVRLKHASQLLLSLMEHVCVSLECWFVCRTSVGGCFTARYGPIFNQYISLPALRLVFKMSYHTFVTRHTLYSTFVKTGV